MTWMRFVLLAVVVAVAGCLKLNDDECYERPVAEEGPWILADHYHSTKQNPEDYRLTKTDFNYQGVFGFYRIFEHLERGGYNWTSIRTAPLSRERLQGFDVLFINLVSSDRPDFSDEEVEAIIEFVDNGGGLFVIVDHTNVYRHAERVNRFLEPMGAEVLYHTAVDYPPEYSVAGLGWIMVWDFADHPVAKDLEMVSLQTGGPIESDGGGVAFTSDKSFADLWDPEDTGGYYGNWAFDGDEEAEPKGPLQVVTALEYGEGRVVIVGDQNIFGDAWTHFGDNFSLAMNSFEWLAGQTEEAEVPLRDVRPVGTLIGMDQKHTAYTGGKQRADAFWVYFVNLNRDPEISGRGTLRFDNVDDVLIFMDPTVEFTQQELDDIRTYFKDGKKVVVTFEADAMSQAGIQLLREFAPDFELTVDGQSVSLDEADALLELDVPRKTGEHLSLKSDRIDVEGLELASYPGDPTAADESDTVEPYLLDVTSNWGDALVTAGDVDIARSKKVEEGELIVFVQDGFWRNRTLGKYLRAPLDYNKDAHAFQYRFLDFLKVEPPAASASTTEPSNTNGTCQ